MKTKNYKFLAILLGLLFMSSVSYAQDTIVVTAPDLIACPGDAVTVDIDGTNINDLGSMSLAVNYDTTVLAYDTILFNADLAAAGFTITNDIGGQIRISWFAIMGSGNLGNITILQIKFDFIAGSSVLEWNTAVPGDCQFTNTGFQDIPTIYWNGSISEPPLSVDVQPISTTILDNANASFAVTATGANSYQWELSVDGGNIWNNVVDGGVYSGAQTAQLDLTAALMSMNGYMYKCSMDGDCNMTLSSDVATLNVVSAITIITNVQNATECVGAVVVPVYATNFNNVGTIDLKLDFDQTKLSYTGVANIDPALTGLTVTDNVDHVLIDWTSATVANIGAGMLFELEFAANAGWSSLTWDTLTAGACQYLDGVGTLFDATFESGQIMINPFPAKPVTPVGPTDLCFDPPDSDYTITGPIGIAYEWMLDPSAAGTISGTGLTATVDWDPAWTGLASVKVRGSNNCGYGVYSDNLNVTIVGGVPLEPGTPTGAITLCINPPNEDYMTTAVAEASSYEWLIDPPNAGLITGAGLTGTVDWGSSFFGTADISVRAVNSCGPGPYSAPLTVTITPMPSTPGTPSGPDSVCVGTLQSVFVINNSPFATSYLWEVSPSSAIIAVIGNDTNATVEWFPGFTGQVTITVKGVNSCGQSMFAGSKTVNIKPVPGMASLPTGPGGMCINSPNSDYNTVALPDADSYEWALSPSGAGSIAGTTTTATVDWDNGFSGSAYVKVKGINVCGNGVFSDSLHITISTPPIFSVGSDTTMCQGNAITFTGPGGMGAYHWSTGATGPSITVLYPGIPFITYALTVTDPQGCTGMDSVNVTWIPTPTVDLGQDTTICDTIILTLDAGPALDYLWSTGETTQQITLVFTAYGTETYSVTITDVSGCVGSGDIDVTWIQCIVGIEDINSDMDVSIAPNPSNGQFNLIVGEVYGEIEMMVLNELGQTVYSDKITENTSGNYSKQYNLANLPKGIYFVKLINERIFKVKRLVIR